MVNEEKAFALIKKTDWPLIYKGDSGYYVADGYFIFKTNDTRELSRRGLIDSKKEPRQNRSVLNEAMTNTSGIRVMADTGLTLAHGSMAYGNKNSIRIFVCGDDEVCMARKYFRIFEGCEFFSKGPLQSIFAYDGDDCVGLVLPLRVPYTVAELIERKKAESGKNFRQFGT